MPENQLFDFKKPIKNVEQPFEEFVKEAESSVHNGRGKNSSRWNTKNLLILILTLNILGLGAFGLLYNSNNSSDPVAEVAGEQDIQNPNVVSGNGYSIVSQSQIPGGYIQSSEQTTLPFLNEQPGSVDRYLIDDQVNGTQIKSGFEIFRTENDNLQDLPAFSQSVLTYLGEGFTLNPRLVTLPKGIQARKIIGTQVKDNISYYTAVTQDNYYLIKVYNQTLELDTLEEYTQFIGNIENFLYLN